VLTERGDVERNRRLTGEVDAHADALYIFSGILG
jgi:hypothetical protein